MPQCSVLVIQILLFVAALVTSQRNQGVRLAESPLGAHAGRVEVKYNGTWGTICSRGWSSNDAAVICRMLNYTGYVCAVAYGSTVFGQGTGNVWITNLQCSSYHYTIDQCSNSIPQNSNPCSHTYDAAVICKDDSVMPIPFNITQLNNTRHSILVGFKLSFIPPNMRDFYFRLNVSEVDSLTYNSYQTSICRATTTQEEIRCVVPSLSFNTSYVLSIRTEGEYQWCPYNELMGKYSDTITVSTSDYSRPSTLPMRLLSQNNNYIGRLQVFHNGFWGNVCDDYFGVDEANVACWSLNYTNGAICYANYPFPLSSAPIVLDDIDCGFADRFEDCIHRGWGVHDCTSYESVGVVCNPGPSAVTDVDGLRVTGVSPNSISMAWEPLPNTQRYRISYQANGDHPLIQYSTTTTSQQTGLVLGVNYSITVSASMDFTRYRGGNCYSRNLYGKDSNPVYVVTQESSPTVAVTGFHVSVLNSTAVEVTWRPPSSITGINGDIRGYKILVEKVGGTQKTINVKGETSRVYHVTGLERSTTYFFSILMYTVGDGPPSVRLKVTTPNSSIELLITKFGVYGDGEEYRRASSYTRGFNVLCGSNIPNTTFEWRFANGNDIGISNPSFRAAHFNNGTAVLQIGTEPTIRYLTVCDGGLYICVAKHTDGRVMYRTFSLTYYIQPRLATPQLIQKGATWIQIGWEPLYCDGGYILNYYHVQYGLGTYYSIYTTHGATKALNYTIRGLTASTEYKIRVGRESTGASTIRYSSSTSIITLSAEPSPPAEIKVVRVGYNSEICVTWKPPTNPNGIVAYYKLYAELISEDNQRVYHPNNTYVKTFDETMRSGCMELTVTGVSYNIHMSTVSIINGRNVEGRLSDVTGETSVFVPKPAYNCEEGKVRLLDGVKNSSGRVEYCQFGNWGSVCSDGWDDRDARVVCCELGFNPEGASSVRGFDLINQPAILNQFACKGYETDLNKCESQESTGNCTSAIVTCQKTSELPRCTGGVFFGQNSYGVCQEYEVEANVCAGVLKPGVNFVYISKKLPGNHQSLPALINKKIHEAEYLFSTQDSSCVNLMFRIACQYYFPPCGNSIQQEAPVPLCKEECQLVQSVCPDTWKTTALAFSHSIPFISCNDTSELLFPPRNCCTAAGIELPQSSSTSASSGGAVAGTVMGVLLFLTVVVITGILLLYFRKRLKLHERDQLQRMQADILARPQQSAPIVTTSTEESKEIDIKPDAICEADSNSYALSDIKKSESSLSAAEETRARIHSNYMREMTRGKFIVKSSNITLLGTIGEGEFGIVYRARQGNNFKVVAVKTLKGHFNQVEVDRFVEESLKMSRFKHSHVMGLIGVCLDAGSAPFIIMPFMANGSLLTYLKRERDNLVLSKEKDLDEIQEVCKRLLVMCSQIASGMQYLAAGKYVHRDLAARNCMIDAHCLIKITDFGLSEDVFLRNYFRQGNSEEAVKLPVKWMAPESLSDGHFSEKSDVWSYGVTMWEIFSGGKVPYPGTDSLALIKHLEEGNRMCKPYNAACNDEIYSVMMKCWESSPKERPLFSEIYKDVTRIIGRIAGYLDVGYNPFTAKQKEKSVSKDETDEMKGKSP